MQRLLLDDLKAWKVKKDRLPLILRGARQVGKTEFEDVLYINFEITPDLKVDFDGDLSPQRILDLLGALHGKRIMPLKAYEDLKAFKLYHVDVGLLRVMSELSPQTR